MAQIQADLSQRIRELEQELRSALEEHQRSFSYHWHEGKPKFQIEALTQHLNLKQGLLSYLIGSRFLVFLTAPILYAGIVPFFLLDLFLLTYQGICFPLYGIPEVKREDYLVFDRGRLKYLNLLERLNCLYCSYANGLCAYATEIAARTEQHWCPIKHAARLRSPHSRYSHFFQYGDAQQYKATRSNTIRRSRWSVTISSIFATLPRRLRLK